MIEHYHKKLNEAIDSLRKLTGQEVEDTPEDVRKAVHWVKCHGSRLQRDYAKEAWFNYLWARNEIEAHEAEAKAAATAVK